MINGGWIKLNRNILNWEWYHDSNTKNLFFHCLLRANYEDQKYRGEVIPKGSFVSSYRHLAEETGLSYQQIRTALEHLKATHEITQTSYSKYTVFTVVRWEEYQCEQHEEAQSINSQSTVNQQSSNNNKRNKEIKNKRNIYSSTTKPNKFLVMDSRDNNDFIASIEDRITRGEFIN